LLAETGEEAGPKPPAAAGAGTRHPF
jgi:hypothetical protein